MALWINIKFINAFGEKFVMVFNRYSNNFGLSWIRGVLFTVVIVSIPLFLLYLTTLREPFFDWGWNGWKEYFSICNISLQFFIQYLNPTHSWEFMEKYSPSPIGIAYFIDAISRILISIGYYQIVQAFRKYRFATVT